MQSIGFTRCLPWGRCGDEELGAVGILSCIGHAEKTNLGVLELEVLVWEFVTVDCISLVHVCLTNVPIHT
jgi:hypothetical protein